MCEEAIPCQCVAIHPLLTCSYSFGNVLNTLHAMRQFIGARIMFAQRAAPIYWCNDNAYLFQRFILPFNGVQRRMLHVWLLSVLLKISNEYLVLNGSFITGKIRLYSH